MVAATLFDGWGSLSHHGGKVISLLHELRVSTPFEVDSVQKYGMV